MIAENLKAIEEKIAQKCLKSGRNLHEITLVAVSKTQPLQIIQESINAGLFNLGENKAQELRDKADSFSGNIKWHFIGHLQTNKVKYIIKHTALIHSVDSIKLAEEINRRAELLNKKQDVLLEIKTSDEAAKYGIADEKEIFNTAECCLRLSNLNLTGLMTMAPFTEKENDIRSSFIKLRNIKDKLNSSGFNLTQLSMGMTNDYEIAIEEGSTILRIGTAIFGQRNY